MQKTMSAMSVIPEQQAGSIVYSFGKPFVYEKSEEIKKEKIRMKKGCYADSPELVISIDRRQEIFSEKDTKIRHGILLHNILEQVHTTDDFEKILNEFRQKGHIEDKMAVALKESFETLMKNSTFAGWFSGKYRIYNEHTLLSGKNIYRPDRIMLGDNTAVVADYKTGEADPGKYAPQIKKYMTLLKETGITNVSGWIVHLDKGLLIEIAHN